MQSGLKLIQIAGGYYGYAVTMVGWLRRARGDEWLLYNARVVSRTGTARLDGFNRLAIDGPEKRYKLTEVAEEPEELHRLLIRRSRPANLDVWLRHCPKPKDWAELGEA